MYRQVGLILTVFFLSFCSFSENITLATWNIRNISDKSRHDAELGIIAAVLQMYDITAVQEVLDRRVMERTKNILNDHDVFRLNYDIITSKPVGSKKKEKYSFVFDADRIKHLDSRIIDDPGIDRDPFFGVFEVGGTAFGLLTVHVIFGRDMEERYKEMLQLEKIYNKLRKDNDFQVFLLGDFNLSADEILTTVDTLQLVNKDHKTTIYDVSQYDNILYSKDNHFLIYTIPSHGVFCLEEVFFPSKSKRHIMNRVVSDHRPLWANVSIGKNYLVFEQEPFGGLVLEYLAAESE